MNLHEALEHLRATAETNGATDVVSWCTLALAARADGIAEVLGNSRVGAAGVPNRWQVTTCPPWGGPQRLVRGVFATEDDAQRAADALNAIEADLALRQAGAVR